MSRLVHQEKTRSYFDDDFMKHKDIFDLFLQIPCCLCRSAIKVFDIIIRAFYFNPAFDRDNAEAVCEHKYVRDYL